MSAVIVKSYLQKINEARRAYRTAYSQQVAVQRLRKNSRFSWRRAFLGVREAWLRRVAEQRGEQFHELHKNFESVLRRYMINIGVPRQYWREFRAIPGLNGRISVLCGGGPNCRLRDRTNIVIMPDSSWYVDRKIPGTL
jgi:hypothetical protein